MSNSQSRHRPFDHAPPARSGSGTGVLLLIGGIVVLFLLAMLFFSGGSSSLPQDATAPVAVTPADGAPAAPVIVE